MERSGVAGLVGELGQGLSTLISEHLELLRVELIELGKGYGSQLGKLLLFAPFVLVGWLFCCAAGASALRVVIGWPFALLAVGGFNLLLGGAGIAFALVRLRRTAVLESSRAEIGASMQTLSQWVERTPQEVEIGR